MRDLFRCRDTGDAVGLFDTPFGAAPAGELGRMVRSARGRAWNPAEIDLRPRTAGGGIMPEAWYPDLRTAAAAGLDPDRRARLGDAILHWLLSGILHGERAALTVCGQLVARFADPDAQAFAANQAGEEARHVEAFARYIALRWGAPRPPGDAFGGYLSGLVATPSVPRKVVGICILVEGFAMGALANIHAHTRDPALRTMLRHVMRDEAGHHGFGTLWAEQALPRLAPDARREAEGWARDGFRALALNLVSIRQRRAVFDGFGLDWTRVRDEVRQARRARRGDGLEDDINPLTALARSLDKLGLLSTGARDELGAWIEA